MRQDDVHDPYRARPAALATRARALSVAPEHVYVTVAPDFTPAERSVGVYGGDGFSSVYVGSKTGAQLQLTVDRGTITAATCPDQQPGDIAGEPVACERDGDLWYRSTTGAHEYAVTGKGHVVRLSGAPSAIGRDVLRAAAQSVRRPNAAELEVLLPPAPSATATEPVERGDLPPVGDGAPNNEVGATG
ncbi:hypothetical protein G5C60_16595 [Streptomyces sp. HC44]|uniref:Uncharacterized protein n=1 Tax=Streptomyces scabichelini TaxID=2711217 RepID=A0A6G4V5Q3_9ACTN|nr:hypothetical protein [Streptomyces scabichelini]NGO09174.1 hypothetical protein [Streptomyces scabichelini]